MAANPSPRSAPGTLRPDLAATIDFDYEMDRRGFIGYRIMPVVEVQLAGDNPGRVPVKDLLRDVDIQRQADGGYTRGKSKFETWQYATDEYGYEETVSDRLVRLYSNIFDVETITTARVLDVVLREDEKRKAAKIFNTTTWTGSALTTAVSTQWSTHSTATPIADVNAAKKKVWAKTGMWPNSLAINYEVFMHLRQCAEIIDRIESTGAGSSSKAAMITRQQLAEVFDLEEVLVAGAARNTANSGQDAAISQIWSNSYAMLAKVARTNDVQEPCIGRTFHWGADGSQVGGAVEQYGENRVRGSVIRARHEVDEVVMYAECGHLLSNVAA